MVEAALRSDLEFFDRLVNLIPAKYYLADPEDHVDLRHMKKADRQAMKEKFKRAHKEARKTSLNPATAKSTLELLKEKVQQEEAARKGDKKDAEPPAIQGRAALQAKLQSRLEEFRKQRKAEESQNKVKKAKEWKEGVLMERRRKVAEKSVTDAPSQGTAQQKTLTPAAQPDVVLTTRRNEEQRLAFSKIEFGDSGIRKGHGRGKPSKAELLALAERKNNTDASSDGKDAWGGSLKRAQGEKVLDDPRLLRKSMKKEAKLKKKKAAAWAERQEKQKEAQVAKQTKRKANLQGRIDAKKEAKKARREKKLLRAGFEGRKRGFITTPSPKTAASAGPK